MQYNEEMDWSPSASQHRAFSTYNPYKVKNTNPRFSDTPIEPKAGPIWYKVPPAPTTPAQRLRNPPMKPIIRESPKETENIFQNNGRGRLDFRSSSSDFAFANPTFFAPEPDDDPREGLTRMFASSFSLSPDPDDEERRRASQKSGLSSFISRFTGSTTTTNNTPTTPAKATTTRSPMPLNRSQQQQQPQQPGRTVGRAAELAVLLGGLAGWIRALSLQDQGDNGAYGLPAALSSLAACLMVSIRLAADLLADEQMAQAGSNKPPPSAFAPSWANLGWLQVVVSLTLMWTVWSGGAAGAGIGPCGIYGNGLFGVAIAHQAWQVFT